MEERYITFKRVRRQRSRERRKREKKQERKKKGGKEREREREIEGISVCEWGRKYSTNRIIVVYVSS